MKPKKNIIKIDFNDIPSKLGNQENNQVRLSFPENSPDISKKEKSVRGRISSIFGKHKKVLNSTSPDIPKKESKKIQSQNANLDKQERKKLPLAKNKSFPVFSEVILNPESRDLRAICPQCQSKMRKGFVHRGEGESYNQMLTCKNKQCKFKKELNLEV